MVIQFPVSRIVRTRKDRKHEMVDGKTKNVVILANAKKQTISTERWG